MFNFLLVVMILDGLLLSSVILMQAGDGGGLASLGGGTTSQVLGGRHATNLLTKTTWWTAGIFMALAMVLTLVAGNRTTGASEVQKRLRQGPPVQQQAPAGTNAIPGLTPAPPAATAPGTTAPVTPPPAGKKP
jgi:preprotein translocase subunit SecG